jgi:hypothetical protein
VTVHVYVLPFDNADTVSGPVAPDADRVVPPFDEVHVAVYAVIGRPPLFAGGANDTDATPSPGAAETSVGGSGTVAVTRIATFPV